jgi:hypothetical protein
MELNQSNPRNSGLKAAIVVLALLLMGSLAYVYKLNQDKSEVDSSLSKTMTEKEKFQSELEAKIAKFYGTEDTILYAAAFDAVL